MNIEEARKKVENRNNKNSKKTFLSSFLSRTLVSVILIFGILIVVNTNPKAKEFIKKNLFTTNYNFAYLNTIYNKYFFDILDNTKKSVAVFNEKEVSKYELYLDGVKKTVKEGSEINLIMGGIVVFIGEKEGYNKTLIVQGSNGIDYWYCNLKDINVKLYDYIETGKEVGTSNNEVYYVFQKDGKFLDYKEILKD